MSIGADNPVRVFPFCPKCGEGNPQSTKFCTSCGGALVVKEQTLDGMEIPSCPSCQKPSPRSTFCGWCSGRREVTRISMKPMAPSDAVDQTMARPGVGGFATAAMGSVAVTMPDGGRGPTFPLQIDGETTIGRTQGELQFPDDAYMSPFHARIDGSNGPLTAFDSNSLNGTYLRMRKPGIVPAGGVVLIGRQYLRIVAVELTRPVVDAEGTALAGSDAPAVLWAAERLMPTGTVRDVIALAGPSVSFGRQDTDVRFEHDTFVSGNHARMEPRKEGVLVTDLESSNGVWIRLTGPCPVGHGDELMVGRVRLTLMLPH